MTAVQITQPKTEVDWYRNKSEFVVVYREPERKYAERPENYSSLQLLIQCARALVICTDGWKNSW